MKAISLWQPWASAIAAGSKRIETRSWQTPYRGALLIHAAQRCVEDELIGCQCTWNWMGALRPVGVRMGGESHLKDLIPFGAIVAVAVLVDVRPTDSFTLGEIEQRRLPEGETMDIYSWTERMMGNFDLGRFGWVLDHIQPFERPIPYKGARGVFDVPDEVLHGAATRELPKFTVLPPSKRRGDE